MRPLTFTLYPHPKATTGQPITQDWHQWCEQFSKHAIRDDKHGPAIVLASVSGPRKRSSVVDVHALSLDIEHQSDETVQSLLTRLRPYTYAAWTTHTSTPDDMRLRIIIPLAEPHTPDKHLDIWKALQTFVGGINDEQTKDACRLNYLPSTPNPELALAWGNEGRWLRADDLPNFGLDGSVRAIYQTSIERLSKLADGAALQRKARHAGGETRELLEALFQGAPFDEGERHQSIVKTSWWLSSKNRKLTQLAIEELYRPTIEAMQTQADPPTLEECWVAYQGALAKRDELQAEQQRQGQRAYSEEDLERIAQAQNTDPKALNKQWIVGREGRWWVLNEHGEYEGSMNTAAATVWTRQLLSRAPVKLAYYTEKGETFIPFLDVASRHGSIARKVITTMTKQATTYDRPSRTVYEATTPLRITEAKWNEQIDRYIRGLCQNTKQYHLLCDWLACVPDLNKLLCALYLHSAPGTGKTLLAHGLAKLWTDGPPGDLGLALSEFNSEILRCPILFADEALPKLRSGDTTTALRAKISTVSHTLNRKYHEANELHGAVRAILAANNADLLSTEGAHTADDFEAIAQRFLYIPVPKESATFLDGLEYGVKADWLKEDIAKHCLWLAENRKVLPTGRFWVTGDVGELHLLLAASTRWNAFVLEWCCGYCMDPESLDRGSHGEYVRRGRGELWVNIEAITHFWDKYVSTDKVQPTTALVAKALKALSIGPAERKRVDDKRHWYWPMNVETVICWAEHVGKGDRETIEAHLNNRKLSSEDHDTNELFEDFETAPAWNTDEY